MLNDYIKRLFVSKPDRYLVSWIAFGFACGIAAYVFNPWLILIVLPLGYKLLYPRLFVIGFLLGMIRIWLYAYLVFADRPQIVYGEANIIGNVEESRRSETCDGKNCYYNTIALDSITDAVGNTYHPSWRVILKSDEQMFGKIQCISKIYPTPKSNFAKVVSPRYFSFFNRILAHGEIKVWHAHKYAGISPRLKQKFGHRAGIVQAILFGDQSNISNDLKEKLNKAGLGYILAVSGMHFSIVGSMFYFLGRWVIGPICVKLFAKHVPMQIIGKIFSLIGVLIYSLIAKPTWSVIRSGLMFIIPLMFPMRRITGYMCCVLTLFIIILIWPYGIFELGLQLSFVAVFTLLRIRGNFITSAIVTTISTAPIILYQIGYNNIQTVLASVICVPIFSFAIIPLSWLCAVLQFPNFLVNILSWCIDFFEYLLPMVSKVLPLELSFRITSVAYVIWMMNLIAYLLLENKGIFVLATGLFFGLSRISCQELILINPRASEVVLLDNDIIFATDPESYFTKECSQLFDVRRVVSIPKHFIKNCVCRFGNFALELDKNNKFISARSTSGASVANIEIMLSKQTWALDCKRNKIYQL